MGGAFEKAVKSISVISDSYCLGLTAMGSYSAKVKATNTRLLEGSVDIDAATKKTYPESNRWDYALGYDGLVYYVEVHPASTSEVNTVIAKKKWLKDWLLNEATPLNEISKNACYYWIQSGKGDILSGSKQRKMLAQKV